MTFADLLYKFFAFLYNYKQTILGSFVAALSFVQASDVLRDLLEPDTYRWTMFVVGLVMVVFANSARGGVVSNVLPPTVPPERREP